MQGAASGKEKGAGQAPFDAVIAAISLYVVLIRKLYHQGHRQLTPTRP